MPTFKDNSPRMAHEFANRLDPRMRAVYLELEHHVLTTYKTPLMVTCIERTILENQQVGGQSRSAHMKDDEHYVRAMDLRTKNLSESAIRDIVSRTARIWGPEVHILRHGGTADHIHVNVNLRYATAWQE